MITDKICEDWMGTTYYHTYLEDEILGADPIRLVQLLYRGALRAVSSARASLERNDINARSEAVNRGFAILVELSTSLDHKRGGELSQNLAALYDYMQRRMLEGHQGQADAPFAEVEQLLQTLEDAWLEIKPAVAQVAESKFPVSAGLAAEAEYVPIGCSY